MVNDHLLNEWMKWKGKKILIYAKTNETQSLPQNAYNLGGWASKPISTKKSSCVLWDTVRHEATTFQPGWTQTGSGRKMTRLDLWNWRAALNWARRGWVRWEEAGKKISGDLSPGRQATKMIMITHKLPMTRVCGGPASCSELHPAFTLSYSIPTVIYKISVISSVLQMEKLRLREVMSYLYKNRAEV